MKFVDKFNDFSAMYKTYSGLYRIQVSWKSILTSVVLPIATGILSFFGLTPVLISVVTTSLSIAANVGFPIVYYFTEYSKPVQVSYPTTRRERGPPSGRLDKKPTIRSVYTIIEFFVKFDTDTTNWVIRIVTPNDVKTKISKKYWTDDYSLTRDDSENLEITCVTGHNYRHFSFGFKAKCTKPFVNMTGWIEIYCTTNNNLEENVRKTRFWYLG